MPSRSRTATDAPVGDPRTIRWLKANLNARYALVTHSEAVLAVRTGRARTWEVGKQWMFQLVLAEASGMREADSRATRAGKRRGHGRTGRVLSPSARLGSATVSRSAG